MRFTFPDEGNRLVYSTDGFGRALKSAAGVNFTVYTDALATMRANITDMDDVVIVGSVVQTDEQSLLPYFKGPDGIITLYVRQQNGAGAAFKIMSTAESMQAGSVNSISPDNTNSIVIGGTASQPTIGVTPGMFATLVSGLLQDSEIPPEIARAIDVDALVNAAVAASQPVDGDLTAISNLTTTVYGRALLTMASAALARGHLGLGDIATMSSTSFDQAGAAASVLAATQPVDADLTAIAALTTTPFGRSILTMASAGAVRTALGLGSAAVASTGDFDPAGAAATALASALAGSQPLDSDLTAIAALATTAFGRSFLTRLDAAAARTLMGLGTAATQATGAFDLAGAAATAQAAAIAASDPLGAAATAQAAAQAASDPLGAAAAAQAAGVAAAGAAQSAAIAASQPRDADLTSIAALATQPFGRSLLTLLDVSAAQDLLDIGSIFDPADFDPAGAADAALATALAAASTAETNAITASQPRDADLTAISALSTTTFGRAFLTLTNAAAGRSALGLGTASQSNVGDFDPSGAASAAFSAAIAASQPLDADLSAIAALATTTFGRSLLTAADATAVRGLISAEQAGAAAAAQAFAIVRGNHTGFQAISTITGLQAILDGIVADDSTEKFDITRPEYGAIAGPGHAAANVAALIAARDDALAAGGYVFAPFNILPYEINAKVNMGHVDLRGSGARLTIFKCMTIDAGIWLGDNLAGYGGPLSGGFWIDANAIATRPFVIGGKVESTVFDVKVRNGVMSPTNDPVQILIIGCQNSRFIGVDGGEAAVIARFDGGAGNNTWIKPEFQRASICHLEFRNDVVTAGQFLYPHFNRIIQPVMEYTETTTLHVIDHRAGLWNHIDGGNLYTSGQYAVPVSMEAMVRVSTDESFQSILRVGGTNFGSNIGASCPIGLLATGGALARIEPGCFFYGMPTAVKGLAIVSGEPQFYGVTTKWDLTGSGYAYGERTYTENQMFPIPGSLVDVSNASGDTTARWQRTAGGTMRWGSGALVYDTELFRALAAVLGLTGTLAASADLVARSGSATAQVIIGDVGSSVAGISLAVDVILYRFAANVATMANGDSFRLQGTWNGGHLLIGTSHYWENATTGELMVKHGSAPSSDTDGALVSGAGVDATLYGGRELESAVTANVQASISTIVDATGLSITFTVTDKPVWVHAHVSAAYSGAGSVSIMANITDAANVVKSSAIEGTPAAGVPTQIDCWERITAAGTYTRKLRLSRTAGAASFSIGITADTTFVSFIKAIEA